MEQIKDILREMRKDMPRVVDTKVILRNYADRIEAAHKREIAELETKLERLRQVAQMPYVNEGLVAICDADIGEMRKPNVEADVSKTETTTLQQERKA